MDELLEASDQVGVRDGVGVFHPRARHHPRRALFDILDRLVARSVDGGEVDDDVSGLVGQVSKHRVDAGGGIGHEHARFVRRIEILGNGGARGVELSGVDVSDEFVGLAFGLVLERVQDGANVQRIGSKRS